MTLKVGRVKCETCKITWSVTCRSGWTGKCPKCDTINLAEITVVPKGCLWVDDGEEME